MTNEYTPTPRKNTNKQVEMFGRFDSFTREQLIQELDSNLKLLSPEEAKTATFCIEEIHEEYNPEPRIKFVMEYKTLENDKEYQNRITQEKQYFEQANKQERATYEALRKKFEPESK